MAAPIKAEFAVAPYGDGSGARVTVKYNCSLPRHPRTDCRNLIWLETGYGDNWIAFEAEHADALCRAIREAARAVNEHNPRPARDDIGEK